MFRNNMLEIRESRASHMLGKTRVETSRDSSYEILNMLNMEPISFEKHGMEILEFQIQLKDSFPHTPFRFPLLHVFPMYVWHVFIRHFGIGGVI